MLKKLIPKNVKIQIRLFQKNWKDIRHGQKPHLVSSPSKTIQLPKQLQLSQVIKANNYSENKIHNLRLASACIKNISIQPGKIFSFWNLIPHPNKKNGFKKGRNLIGEGLSTDYGGGLCQLSGILYHLSLLGGLQIVERYPHSKDIYTEQTRYTPLGSDATVVFGYKDLRIKNNLEQEVCFDFEIENDKITAHLCAKEVIKPSTLFFESFDLGAARVAKVYREKNNARELISKDKYEQLVK